MVLISTGRGFCPGGKENEMFKKLLKRITEAKNANEAWDNVFYGADGIDMAYQQGKINAADYELLVAVLEKMA